MFQFFIDWLLTPTLVIAGYLILDYFVHFWTSVSSGHTEDETTKCVLITGCDSGFGHDSAVELSGSGCKVLAGCLTEAGVTQLEEDPNFNGIVFRMDVTKREDIQKSVELVAKEVGEEGLYAIVNNAGILVPGPLDWQTEDDLRKVMEVNCWGTVMVTKALLPFLKKRTNGSRIINVSSMAGRVMLGYGASYCMSKFAVEAFSDGLRYELKPYGISVHLIEPGMFKTSILSPKVCTDHITALWKKQNENTKEEYGEEYHTQLCTRYEDLIEKIASTKSDKVVSSIKHAVLSRRAKPRYVIGVDGNTIWMAVATLPTSIGDWILSTVSPALSPRITITKKSNDLKKVN